MECACMGVVEEHVGVLVGGHGSGQGHGPGQRWQSRVHQSAEEAKRGLCSWLLAWRRPLSPRTASQGCPERGEEVRRDPGGSLQAGAKGRSLGNVGCGWWERAWEVPRGAGWAGAAPQRHARSCDVLAPVLTPTRTAARLPRGECPALLTRAGGLCPLPWSLGGPVKQPETGGPLGTPETATRGFCSAARRLTALKGLSPPRTHHPHPLTEDPGVPCAS